MNLQRTERLLGPGLHKQEIKTSELGLTESAFFRQLGYSQGLDTAMRQTMLELFQQNQEHIEARFLWAVFDDNLQLSKNAFSIKGLSFYCGKRIAPFLAAADSLLLFVATIGPGLERQMQQSQQNGDPFTAFVLDALGSLAADSCAEYISRTVEEAAKKSGTGTTNRYSPGYCGWNVADQKQLFALLPAEQVGISLKESCLMLPVKSVSGVIALGAGLEKKPYPCRNCDNENCLMRREQHKNKAKSN